MIDTHNGTQGLDLRTVNELNAKTTDKAIGQEEFLKLMTTQLQNQDPFKPMESGDFLTQIAQFSTVEGIGDLNKGFDELSQSLVSNQALQATNLVGRQVLAPTGVAALEQGGTIRNSVKLPAASDDVVINIYDQTEQVMRKLELGAQSSRPVAFQ